jgi:tetrahydromethanopterin S-methyltransferase subunit G
MSGDEITLGELARRLDRLEARLDAMEERYRRYGWMIGMAIASPILTSLAPLLLRSKG